MSGHIRANLPCDNCGSSDALAEYSSGTYCFSCKKFTPSRPALAKILESSKPVSNETIKNLPEDCSQSFPNEPLKWLKQYGITDAEIIKNNIQWSHSNKGIIFPIYDETGSNLVAWSTRNFGSGPKSYFFGKKSEVIHIISFEKIQDTGILVFVEDIISSIKVGRVFPCLCLFGCSMNYTFFSKLPDLIKIKPNLVIWLDSDKFGEAMNINQRLRLLDFNSSIVHTLVDPKMFDESRINSIILSSLEEK